MFPIVCAGGDLVACAQTGTGKTAAFLLPIMNRLLGAGNGVERGPAVTRVLVLAPTRELAAQIDEDFDGFSYGTTLSSAAVYGGVDPGAQSRALRARVDLVVATPGRLLDHLNTGDARFGELEVLVLDEADRMLDMGFWPDVRRIVATLPATRQTLLFAATISQEVMRSAAMIMRDAKMVRIGRTSGLAVAITHVGYLVPSREKAAWLASFLRRSRGSSLVFVRTKRGADRLARQLASGNVRCVALHAGRTQGERTAAIEGFRSGRHRVLVATDIAARGLDIDRIEHIINYEVPANVDTYVHRVGRTGRADECGTAVTLAAPEEVPALRVVERSLNLSLLPA